MLQVLFTIINALSLGVSVWSECRDIRQKLFPIMASVMLLQAVQFYLFIRPPVLEKTRLSYFVESAKVAVTFVCGLFCFMYSFSLLNDEEEMWNAHPASEFCTTIGLLTNCTMALCTALVPYVTFSSWPFKLGLSGSICVVHGFAPFWASLQIELPAILINVAVGNALGYIMERSLRSTFREQYARQVDQDFIMQMKVAANMRLTHTIKGNAFYLQGQTDVPPGRATCCFAL